MYRPEVQLVPGVVLNLVALNCVEGELCDVAGRELVLGEVGAGISLRYGVVEVIGGVQRPQSHREGEGIHHMPLVLHVIHYDRALSEC
jgi:hypothetical protein